MYGYSIGSKTSSSPTLSKKLAMYVPDYTQGVVIKTFESISYVSCKYKVDRILRLKISNLE